jgi:hypothetical protein
MMLRNLGGDHVAWDKAGAIRDVKPGRGPVCARFRLGEADVAAARHATALGGKHEPTFRVDVVDAGGDVIAVVEKTLHVRRHAPVDAPAGRPA